MNGWSTYWLWWAVVSFGSFIVPESWALLTNSKNTLSWQLWTLMEVTPGQPIRDWSASHILIGGMLTVCLVWLIGHFALGIWR